MPHFIVMWIFDEFLGWVNCCVFRKVCLPLRQFSMLNTQKSETMKKTVMLAVMLMAVCAAKAQLKVDSLGKVGIGVTPATPFKLSVYSAKCGIRGVSTESASDSSAIGVMGAGYIPYHGKAYGLKGMSDSNGVFLDGKSFGVFGYAHGSNSGENYGVFGHVGPHVQGAGVYGSSYFGPDYGIMLQSRYAGYFSGDVMVTSNLTVLGALLYSSDHLYSIGSGDDLLGNDITISKQLQPLSAKRYGYHMLDHIIITDKGYFSFKEGDSYLV